MRKVGAKGTASLLRHISVAVLYGIAYAALNSVYYSDWNMLGALRVASLLLLPYRYWPALLIGEAAPLIYMNYPCLPDFGWAWVLFTSIPPSLFVMPVIHLLRQKLPGEGRPLSAHMGSFIFGTLIISLIIAARGVAQYHIGPLTPATNELPLLLLSERYLLGAISPILAYVPFVFLVYETRPWRFFSKPRAIGGSPWVETSVAFLSIALMTFVGLHTDPSTTRFVQLSLFVPVAVFALVYGWQGAALMGALASTGIMLLMPGWNDIGTLEAQTLMCFVLLTLLMLGARTSLMNKALENSWRSLSLARQELYQHELKMRNKAQELEQVNANMQAIHSGLMHRMQFVQAGNDEQGYRHQLLDMRQRLARVADSLSPREWQRMGSPNALGTGPLATALKNFGVTYGADIRGQMSLVPQDMNIAVYRLACEAVVLLLGVAPTDSINVETSTFHGADDRLEVTLRVTSAGNVIKPVRRDSLKSELCAAGMTEDEIRSRALLYSGDIVTEVIPPGGMKITVVLRDYPSTMGLLLSH
jgi:glucose-6-phosphate-specific signal transduction histidine kinase